MADRVLGVQALNEAMVSVGQAERVEDVFSLENLRKYKQSGSDRQIGSVAIKSASTLLSSYLYDAHKSHASVYGAVWGQDLAATTSTESLARTAEHRHDNIA